MKLNDASIKNRAQWESAGFVLPSFDRVAVTSNTKKNPEWVHFGPGNIFRAFPAAIQQKLLDVGKSSTGIIAVGGYDQEVIEKGYRPFDNLSLLVTLKADGTIGKTVIGSVVEALVPDPVGSGWKRLLEVFRSPSLKMASFTITEKGYNLTGANGTYLGDVSDDLRDGPSAPKSTMGIVASLCFERWKNGALPLALVSMDNCSHNGTRLYESIHAIAEKWVSAGFAEKEFLSYIENPKKVSFPWSMIDKITPRPDPSVCEMLTASGFEDTELMVTAKNTFVSAFVNAEEAEYLVIEDAFPNGRPPLEAAGVLFATRETVDRVEKMKVCTCLNPLHTALAVFGCLLGYTLISKEMHDKELRALVEKIGYQEGLPVVVDPGIIDPRKFINDVLTVRLPNPFLPDTPQRIATDTSQKLPVRFGETIKAYTARADLDPSSLVFIPLVFAGWCRYLMAHDDTGTVFELSADPLLEKVRAFVSGIKLGDKGPFGSSLKGLLSDASIFGVNLYKAGLGEKVEGYFAEMVAGPGAVRKTLVKYLS